MGEKSLKLKKKKKKKNSSSLKLWKECVGFNHNTENTNELIKPATNTETENETKTRNSS